MKPERALELVQEYAVLSKELKTIKPKLSKIFTSCSDKQKRDNGIVYPHPSSVNFEPHLFTWYQVEYLGPDSDDGCTPNMPFDMYAECFHCANAHGFIQRRKAIKQRLGRIKSIFSRYGMGQ